MPLKDPSFLRGFLRVVYLLPLMALAVLFEAGAGPAGSAAQGSLTPIEGLLEHMTFRSIGPATMGGRVDDFAVFESRPAVYYAGAATGGLWKTMNNGTTWESVFDHQDVASIGAVAIPQDNPNLVWVGTGEDNNRQSSSWGGGVFKSTDGGRSWQNMGLMESRHIGRIVVDPVDHEVVYVAATGHLWGPNKERGVYKTTDGGLTWQQSLFVDEQTGATDLAMDPSNNKVLYAAMYQRQRTAWGFNGGGPGSGLYKSADAGATWTRLNSGLPTGPLGRIGIDIFRSDSKIVCALIQHESESGLYRSVDAGAHWTKMGTTNPRPNYFSQVRVDPNDERRVYVLGVRLMVSDDEGRTFKEVRLSYSRPGGERPRDDLDVHAMWIDPRDASHLIIGSDVGIAASYDRGATWDYLDNLPIGQFYHVGYDMDTPYRVYGGLQDNDVWGGPSAVRNRFGIGNREWFTLSIGDGFVAMADPRDARTLYVETQDGSLVRVDRDTNEKKSIRPQAGRGDPPLRWDWNTPLIISPHDPNTVLTAAQKIFRSPDRGQSWQVISPDLTSGVDRDTLPIMGVAGREIRLSRNDGVSAYPAIVALAESPKKAGVYYAGANDGTVQVSRDGGKTWVKITGMFPGLPAGAAAAGIVASAFDEATAYVAFNNHRADDYSPYIYMTSDYGGTWTSLSASLPAGQAINCVTEDPRSRNVLYLGTEFGLFLTFDKGQHWVHFKSNLPTVPIDEITIHPRENDMLLATHGRSIWILDDISPLQQAAEAAMSEAFLFRVRDAFQFSPSDDHANYPGDRRFWGRNPEFGAPVSYYLKDVPKDIRITIRDGHGAIVREMSVDDLLNYRSAGLNRFYWDLRHQPLESGRGGRGGVGGGGFGGGGSFGPFVLPGAYKISLTVNGRDVGSRSMRVSSDPQVQISDADRKLQHDTALALHDYQHAFNDASAALSSVNDQLRAAQDLLKQAANAPAAAVAAADSLAKRLAVITQQLGAGAQAGGGGGRGGGPGGGAQPIRNQIPGIKSQIMASTSAPTLLQMQVARESRELLVKLIPDLNNAAAAALPELFKILSDNKMNPPPLKPIPPVKVTGILR